MLRVLLLLLLLLTAMPAPAASACHEAPAASHAMPAHAMSGEHRRAPEPLAAHACPGCIPLGDWLAEPLPAPMPLPHAAPMARIVTLDLGRASPPLLRPPRLG